jgi:hypothetical protein
LLGELSELLGTARRGNDAVARVERRLGKGAAEAA